MPVCSLLSKIYTHYKGALFKVESYLDGTERAYQIGISVFGIEMW